jgi:hypothetical protein
MIRRKTNKFESRKLMLERRIAKLEAMLDPIKTKFVYKINSSMTDNNFYFISDNESILKSAIDDITDMFMESAYCEDDDERDEIFNNLMDYCNENDITYENDLDESPIMTYEEYLDYNGIDSYDDSIDLDDKIYVDHGDIYKVKFIGRYSERF